MTGARHITGDATQDLKLGKLTHQDLGQMQMYVNFFDRTQRAKHEARTIGIVLCSEQNDAMVKITLPESNKRILAARYQMFLPTEEELRAKLAHERRAVERTMHQDPAPRVKRLGSGGSSAIVSQHHDPLPPPLTPLRRSRPVDL